MRWQQGSTGHHTGLFFEEAIDTLVRAEERAGVALGCVWRWEKTRVAHEVDEVIVHAALAQVAVDLRVHPVEQFVRNLVQHLGVRDVGRGVVDHMLELGNGSSHPDLDLLESARHPTTDLGVPLADHLGHLGQIAPHRSPDLVEYLAQQRIDLARVGRKVQSLEVSQGVAGTQEPQHRRAFTRLQRGNRKTHVGELRQHPVDHLASPSHVGDAQGGSGHAQLHQGTLGFLCRVVLGVDQQRQGAQHVAEVLQNPDGDLLADGQRIDQFDKAEYFSEQVGDPVALLAQVAFQCVGAIEVQLVEFDRPVVHGVRSAARALGRQVPHPIERVAQVGVRMRVFETDQFTSVAAHFLTPCST
ncbi:hypothetical protein D3C87_1245480 [compost metagenome]